VPLDRNVNFDPAIRSLKLHKSRAERLNLVLRSIRNVNQLLVKEKDRAKLIQGICDIFINNRGYHNAWIILLDETGRPVLTAEAGLGRKFSLIAEQLKRSAMTQCARAALCQSGVVLTEDPVSDCIDCPLSGSYAGRGGMTIRLEYEGNIYGIMAMSIPQEFMHDKEEHGLVEEIAGDIAFGLHNIDLEEEREQVGQSLQKTIQALNERIKELNCLYSISGLVEKQGILLEEILQGTVDFIPPALQYPEIACARIILENREFKTSNFKEAIWKLEGDIIVYSVPKGTLEVCYLKEPPEQEEGPFMKEERDLLNAIVERLGRIVERHLTQHALEESERRFRELIEYSPIGISIIQNDRIVYQNPEQERLLGPLPRPAKLIDYESIHPDDVDKIKEFYMNLTLSKIQSQETEFRFYPIDESGNRLDMKWVHCRAIRIEYQGRDGILVNMMDVTRTKELEKVLRVQDKMSSLGRVTAGIAHEIRNPLSGINVYLTTMEKMYDRGERPEQLKKIFRQVQSASNKIESVIRRVMDFSKPSEPNLDLIDINTPIEEAIGLSSVTLRKRGIKLEKALSKDVLYCNADPQLIEQVILNLLTNAAEAMKNVKGEKRIGVASAMKNDFITVRVYDSGPGVPLNAKEKVFDPFYTTKNGSTGIGLSLSHRIIVDHGGSLKVCPSEWEGAEFRIEIPLSKGKKSR
jgi:PAS domain S-box-containing protein